MTAPPGIGAAPLRRDRAFLLYLGSRSATITGSAVTAVAMPVLVLELSGSAFLTAAVTAIEAVPYLLFGLLAGAVADRVPRRPLMLGCHLVCAAGLGSLVLAHLAGVLTVGHVLAVAALLATGFVWFDAAAFGALPALVGRERLVAANSVLWTSGTALDLAVPAVAGLLVAGIGPALTLGVDAVAYLLAAAALGLVPRSLQPARSAGDGRRPRIRQDIAEGLRFVLGHPLVRSLTLLGVGNSLTGGVVAGLLVVHATRSLGLTTDDWRIGLLFAAVAAGALLASLLLGPVSRRLGVGPTSIAALTVHPAAIGVLAAAPGMAVAVPALVVWSAAYTLAIVNGITTRQLVTPDHLQSRVNTTARMVAWGGAPLGALLGGALAVGLGVRWALLLGAAAVLGSAVSAWTTPVLRQREVAPA